MSSRKEGEMSFAREQESDSLVEGVSVNPKEKKRVGEEAVWLLVRANVFVFGVGHLGEVEKRRKGGGGGGEVES